MAYIELRDAVPREEDFKRYNHILKKGGDNDLGFTI